MDSLEDQDLDEAEVFVPADANGYRAPAEDAMRTPSQQRSTSGSQAASRQQQFATHDRDAAVNSHYLDPPIRTSASPIPRSVPS